MLRKFCYRNEGLTQAGPLVATEGLLGFAVVAEMGKIDIFINF